MRVEPADVEAPGRGWLHTAHQHAPLHEGSLSSSSSLQAAILAVILTAVLAVLPAAAAEEGEVLQLDAEA